MEGYTKLEQVIPALETIKKDYVELKKQSDDIKKAISSQPTDKDTLNARFLDLEKNADLAFKEYIKKIEENSKLIRAVIED